MAILSSYPTKHEWNNYFIKYQTRDKNISNFIFYRLEFSAISRVTFPRTNLDKLQNIGFLT